MQLVNSISKILKELAVASHNDTVLSHKTTQVCLYQFGNS